MAPPKGKGRKGRHDALAKGKRGKSAGKGKSGKSAKSDGSAKDSLNVMLPGDMFLKKSMFFDPWEKLYPKDSPLAAHLQDAPPPWNQPASNPKGLISKSAPSTPSSALTPRSDIEEELYRQVTSDGLGSHLPRTDAGSGLLMKLRAVSKASVPRDSTVDHGDLGRSQHEQSTSSLLMKLRALPKARGVPRKRPNVPLFSDTVETSSVGSSMTIGDVDKQCDTSPTLLMKLSALPKARTPLPNISADGYLEQERIDLANLGALPKACSDISVDDESFAADDDLNREATSGLAMKLQALPKARAMTPLDAELEANARDGTGEKHLGAISKACLVLHPCRDAVENVAPKLVEPVGERDSAGDAWVDADVSKNVVLDDLEAPGEGLSISKACPLTLRPRADVKSDNSESSIDETAGDDHLNSPNTRPLTLRARKDVEAKSALTDEVGETSVGDIDLQLENLLEQVEKDLDEKPVTPIVLKPRVSIESSSPATEFGSPTSEDCPETHPIKLRPRREPDLPTSSASSEEPSMKRAKRDAFLTVADECDVERRVVAVADERDAEMCVVDEDACVDPFLQIANERDAKNRAEEERIRVALADTIADEIDDEVMSPTRRVALADTIAEACEIDDEVMSPTRRGPLSPISVDDPYLSPESDIFDELDELELDEDEDEKEAEDVIALALGWVTAKCEGKLERKAQEAVPELDMDNASEEMIVETFCDLDSMEDELELDEDVIPGEAEAENEIEFDM